MLMLLGQADAPRTEALRSMQQRFSVPVPDIWFQILLGLVILGGLLGLVWTMGLLQRRRSEPAQLQPAALYRRAVRCLNLPLTDAWRLWRLARITRMPHPTSILLSPVLFDTAVQNYCATRGWLRSRAGAEPHFAILRRKLFET
ncbi:MAG: hypothetical protein AMXMBFR13_15310 [Phycisphaerae bacterium]